MEVLYNIPDISKPFITLKLWTFNNHRFLSYESGFSKKFKIKSKIMYNLFEIFFKNTELKT